MSSKVLYKKGYLIRVHSWENDLDSPLTEEITIESEAEARRVVEFAWLFRSQNDKKLGIGNIYDPNDDDNLKRLTKVFLKYYKKYYDLFTDDERPKDNEELIDWLMEFAWKLGLSSSEFYTRVCDKVEVFYFDHDVICEEIKWG